MKYLSLTLGGRSTPVSDQQRLFGLLKKSHLSCLTHPKEKKNIPLLQFEEN